MKHTCPNCGSPLPESASFCPYCAHEINVRVWKTAPLPFSRTVLALILVLAAAVLAAAGYFTFTRPQVCDGVGEVLYSCGGTDYQLLVAWPNNRCQPAPDIYQSGKAGEPGRWPSRFYVNYKETGAGAWDEFEPLVQKATVEVVQDETGTSALKAGEPTVRDDYSPDAAMVSSLDFDGVCGSPQVVWTLEMKNGDVIRVRQNIIVTLIRTLSYDYHDYPMNTTEELASLLEQIDRETDPMDEVKIYLPPVTYTDRLELKGRSYEFHGCTDGSGRTVFTNTVQVTTEQAYWINYFYDIDFIGDGGVGISSSVKSWAERCSFTGWKTGVLGYGTAWVNVIDCLFEDNEVGFHFNSTGQSASHSLYNDNRFRHNGIAVLLEQVPTDMALDFVGSEFMENETDVDNRCGHSVDLSQAVFPARQDTWEQ